MPPRRPTPGAAGEPGGPPGLLISAPRVIPASPGSGVLAPGYVAIAGGLVTEVGPGPPPRSADLELTTGVLVPGFVDLQVNGYHGVELRTARAAGWELVAGRLPETGTTAFLPTFITAPLDELTASLRAAAAITAALPRAGARVLGVHLEGPFISPGRAGAHNRSWIIPPSPAAVGELLAAGSGLVTLVTLAPERAARRYPVLDVEHQPAGILRRRQHGRAVRAEPVDVVIGVDPAVGAGVGVGRAGEPQVNGTFGENGKPQPAVAPGNAIGEKLVECVSPGLARTGRGPTERVDCHA